MKSKNMTLMVVAIGCGLVAAFLTARLSGGSGPEMIDVWVAKKEIPVGTVLDEKEFDSFVGQTKLPKASLPPDLISSVDELKGKRVNRTLKPGNYFAPGDVGADSGIKLPDGMRKYSVRTDVVKSAGGFVEPGKKVDVVLTEPQPNGKAKSGIILQNMLVVAVDKDSRPGEGVGTGQAELQSVSLAVTGQQSLILANAEKRGEVKLLLRDENSKTIKDEDLTMTQIPGFDKETKDTQAAPPSKFVPIVVAKADVPMNTFITADNVDLFFTTKEIPEELMTEKLIKDLSTLRDKYITKVLEADQQVFKTMLGNDKVEIQLKTVFVEKTPANTKSASNDPSQPEQLPSPRVASKDPPIYPRKFQQIINNQSVWFIETGPGQFRRFEGAGQELKDVPTTSGSSDDKKEKKTENASDRAA